MNQVDGGTRAETVGSLLRPAGVAAVVMSGGADRAVRDRAVLDRAVLDRAVLEAIRLQEEAGLDVITDGETRRRTWAETPNCLDCFESVAGTTGLDWRGGVAAPPAGPAVRDVVVRPVSTAATLRDRTAQFAFLAEHATRRTKFTLAAPSYHRRYWSQEHSQRAYRSCEDFLREIRDRLRVDVERLVALGCDYIQLDAPNYGSMCDQDTRAAMAAAGRDLAAELAFDAALDSSLFDGVSGVTRALHICRGNAAGGRWHSAGGYGAISAELFPALAFDRLLLEYDTDRAGDFGPLSDVGPTTTAVLGLLTTKSGELEGGAAVRDRLAEAAAVKPLGELAISTQCGFASVASGNPVTVEQQRAKLELVVALARETWGPLKAR
jgi:5-methyltetrahydropteroyltriglutamate--homocysteine methyltransferase